MIEGKGLGIERDFSSYLKEIAKKWQDYWEKEKIYNSDPQKKKKKFFLTAAYPYPNAPLHLGHGLTYTIPDVIARYKRMRGYNVLFPMGFHFTGTPILTKSEAIAKGDKAMIEEYTKIYGVPEKDIEKLKTPLGMARYFREWAEKDLRNLLLSIDWRRKFTTIDPEYNKFIEWQFHKLKEKGLLVQGTHPVGWCPLHHNPVSMHDTLNDVEPEIQEYTLIFFKDKDNIIFPAATLRPETVFGVTNVWVNSKAMYKLLEIDGNKFIVSRESAFKLKFQKKNLKELGEIPGEKLVGKKLLNPVTKKEVEILDSSFVDPTTGTGIVMSVPAHAPYDFVALLEKIKDPLKVPVIPLIKIEGYSEVPARDLVVKEKILSVKEKEKLDKITKRIYLDEHEKGVMREDIVNNIDYNNIDKKTLEFIKNNIAGKPVKEARELLEEWLQTNSLGDKYYEIANKPVYCRCGTEIVVKILENQWFIDYENPEWKNKARIALRNMDIVPEDYRSQFEYTIDWLKRKACARSRGLGTRLPWDKEWIIESLSDSTIYMAFYTIIHKIREANISPEKLALDFWDYIFLGKGDPEEISRRIGVTPQKLQDMREEFLYWYPLDNRHSGKDLIPNHLTFFIFNHVAIFPEKLWPRRIVVNGHVLNEGMKMSKSLGNTVPLYRAIERKGPDVLRLTLISAAEVGNDTNYTSRLVESITEQLERIYKLYKSIYNEDEKNEEEKKGLYEKILESKFKRRTIKATEALENYRLREAAITIFSLIENDIKWYIDVTKKKNIGFLKKILKTWVKLMAPFTPAFAEELWHVTGEKESIFKQTWPEHKDIMEYPEEELAILYAEEIINDIKSIEAATKRKAKKATIIVYDEAKINVIPEIIKIIENEGTPRKLIKLLIDITGPDKKIYEKAKHIQEFILTLPESIRKLLKEKSIKEKALIEHTKEYIEEKLNIPINVYNSSEMDETIKGQKRPLPFRPSILIEFQ